MPPRKIIWRPLSTRVLALVCFALSACGMTDHDKADPQESDRIACLDKMCPGDAEPLHDYQTEEAFKLNGEWYIGPKEYGNPNYGPMRLNWPAPTSLTPGTHSQDLVEFFVHTRHERATANDTYEILLKEQESGHVVGRRTINSELEAWETKTGSIEETWFIAKKLTLPTGNPPVISCRGRYLPASRCTGGFLWRENIAVSFRFSGLHRHDWPQIYLETDRILSQIKRAEK